MRITRILAAGAALAVAAACGQQRSAAGPAPAAERDFEFVATNTGPTACGLAYAKKGDSTAVVIGEVPAGGIVAFTVGQPERGADYLLHASCGDYTFTRDLRPRRRMVSIGTAQAGSRVQIQERTRCGGLSRYTPQTPECGIPTVDGGRDTPSTRGREGTGGGSGGAGNSDPAVGPTGQKP
jgi:hypothetical protein